MPRRTFKLNGHEHGWLVLGDAIKGMARMEAGSVDLVFADPPFGLAQMAGGKIEKAYNRKKEYVLDGYTEIHPLRYKEFTEDWLRAAYYVLRTGGGLWVMSGWTHAHVVHEALLAQGFKLLNKVVWKYNFGVWTTRKLVTSHYEMFYACKPPDGRRTFNRLLGNDHEYDRDERRADYLWRQDVWDIKREYQPGRVKNITKLPNALVRRVIEMTTNLGDVILDPFVGNGTTYVEGLRLGRKVIGFEVNKGAYVHASEEAREALKTILP